MYFQRQSPVENRFPQAVLLANRQWKHFLEIMKSAFKNRKQILGRPRILKIRKSRIFSRKIARYAASEIQT